MSSAIGRLHCGSLMTTLEFGGCTPSPSRQTARRAESCVIRVNELKQARMIVVSGPGGQGGLTDGVTFPMHDARLSNSPARRHCRSPVRYRAVLALCEERQDEGQVVGQGARRVDAQVSMPRALHVADPLLEELFPQQDRSCG